LFPRDPKIWARLHAGWLGKHRLHRLRKEWSFHKVPRARGGWGSGTQQTNMGSLNIFKITNFFEGEIKECKWIEDFEWICL